VLRGDTFVFKSGRDGRHLWVVASDPAANPQVVLLLNLTTIRNLRNEDLSCTFAPGEHEWIDNESYVKYRFAETHTARSLELMDKPSIITTYSPFSDQLLNRIYEGAANTLNLDQDLVDLLKAQGFVA
jgi:hypothetical protein